MAAAAIAFLVPAGAQGQTTDPGNFTFHCPGCTTTGNASDPTNTYFALSVDATGNYSFYATGSANDIFLVTLYTDPQYTEYHVFDPWAGGGPNSLGQVGSGVLLQAGVQYYVGAEEELCDAGNQACRITIQSWVLDGETPPPPVQVPEPGTMMLLGSGLFGLAGMARRRRRQQL